MSQCLRACARACAHRGGTRAAAGLRPVLSELGCLPVSSMVHVPKAHQVFDEAGVPAGGDEESEQVMRS